MERGCRPLPKSNSASSLVGGAPAPCGLVCFLLMAHKAHNFSRGVPVTSRYSGKMPEPLGTLPMSKHSHPIYRSLRVDHFETHRHVRDHIRNSELPLVHQNTKTHNTDRHRTLSVWTLRVRELCIHDRDMSPVNDK